MCFVSECTCVIPPFVRAKEYLHPTRFVHMEVLQSSTYLPNIPRNIKRQTQTTDGFEHFLKINGFDVLQKYHHTPIYKKGPAYCAVMAYTMNDLYAKFNQCTREFFELGTPLDPLASVMFYWIIQYMNMHLSS